MGTKMRRKPINKVKVELVISPAELNLSYFVSKFYLLIKH